MSKATDAQRRFIWHLGVESFQDPEQMKLLLDRLDSQRSTSWAIQHLHKVKGGQSALRCIACLEFKDTDADGLCRTCQPTDDEHRAVLLALLTEPKELRVTTSEGAK